MISCFRCFTDCFESKQIPHTRFENLPSVSLDTEHIGNDVVVVKNGRRICGRGAALCNIPIAQDKAYFEVKIQQSGLWGCGLAHRTSDLNHVPLGENSDSWVFRQDGKIYHGGNVVASVTEKIEEGDILGVTFDHVELVFYLNGDPLNLSVQGIKGTVYPIAYVDDGAILEVSFSEFSYRPPSGFEKLMIEQTIL